MFRELLFVCLFIFFFNNTSYAIECNVDFDEQKCDDEYCFFKKDGKTGLYNKKTCAVLENPEYENIEYFISYNSFILKKDNKYGISEYTDYLTTVDKILLLPLEYDSIKKITYYEAKIEKNGKFAIYDSYSKKSTKFYDDIKMQSGDIYILKNGKWRELHPIKYFFKRVCIALMFLTMAF